MTAKEYLNQAYIIDRRINMIIAKADKMRQSLYGRGQALDPVGGGKGNADKDIVSNTVAMVIDYENKANELIDKLIHVRFQIENSIQDIGDDVQREVLERRYLLYQDWESHFDKRTGEYVKGIAEEMNYGVRQIHRIHRKALIYMSVNVSECQ